MSLPVVSVSRISKHFDKVIAVDDVSFDVALRSTTALLGGNGDGKTTTLSMLLGLLLPTSGQISIFGVDVQRQRYRVLPRMNFSSPYVDLPRRLTVRENLTVYAHLSGQISIFGVDVQRQRYRVLPRMNFSSPYVDLPRRLTVRENLTVYAHLYG